jgi:CubicO group peptidase (beta-lactamase class C family)
LGHTACSGGLFLTAEEFSRLGITLLQNGVCNDNHVFPSDYVKRMQTNWIDTTSKNHAEIQGGYGYQVCSVLNGYNAVITVAAHNEEEHKDILTAIWTDILPLIENHFE